MTSPKNAAGRKAIAAALLDTAERYSAEVEIIDQWPAAPSRETMVGIRLGDAYVNIALGACEAANGYIVPWNTLAGSDARFSPAFGAAVGAEVNRFHRRKCMGCYPPDLDTLLRYVDRALRCIADGEAFLEKED